MLFSNSFCCFKPTYPLTRSVSEIGHFEWRGKHGEFSESFFRLARQEPRQLGVWGGCKSHCGSGDEAPGSSCYCAFSKSSNWLRFLLMLKLQSTPAISNTVISNFPLSWTKPISPHFSTYLSTQIRPILATLLSRTFCYFKQNFFPVSKKPLRL